jgi:hypothetical protein
MFISRRRFAATCALLFAACFLLPSRAVASPILCIAEAGSACSTSSLSKVVSVGDTFDLDIFIDSVTDLTSFLIDQISFNPSVLNISTLTTGSFFSDNCPSGACSSWISPEAPDNSGTIDFISGGLDEPSEGVSGSGALARLTFTAIGPGFSLVNFAAFDVFGPVFLQDSLGNLFAPTDYFNARVDVNGVAPVPEPSTLFLVGTGLAFAARRKRSRKIRN